MVRYLPAKIFICLALTLCQTSQSSPDLLDKWLAHQAKIEHWHADVVQIRHIKNLTRPLRQEGELWFIKPNRFRWQLGTPVRTLAVRNAEQLVIAYPKLKQAEKYPFANITDPAMRQILLLLEVGFPSDADQFRQQYTLLNSEPLTPAADNPVIEFQLQPAAVLARKLLDKVSLEVDTSGMQLKATHLYFGDGSVLTNEFHNAQYNEPFPKEKLDIDLSGYSITEPLSGGK
ncbi:outer membrane lipoprotein carrier protein LolA [Teredinibacter turnerae]|uniref:LolA family protein n=1 Tax=Teredinibacter turnerae TaxID=2426 RepID=UPI0030CB49AF